MLSWKNVGHEEHTLYALCLDKKPEDRNALQALLMKELGDVTKVPSGVNFCELIADTAAYFIPTEHSWSVNGLIWKKLKLFMINNKLLIWVSKTPLSFFHNMYFQMIVHWALLLSSWLLKMASFSMNQGCVKDTIEISWVWVSCVPWFKYVQELKIMS